MSGQDLANELERRKGEKPSPGTIYPALKSLKEANLITERRENKFIFYSLTDDGKKGLKRAKERFCRTFADLF